MTGWIPCSRAFPELREPVLCLVYGDYHIGTLRTYGEGLYWDFAEFDYVINDFDDVVA